MRKNTYAHRAKISEASLLALLRQFSDDCNCMQISKTTGLNRNTVNRYVNAIREQIAEHSEAAFDQHMLEELRDSDGLLPQWRAIVSSVGTSAIGVFDRDSGVFAELLSETCALAMRDLIRGRITLDDIAQLRSWKPYDVVVHIQYRKHFRINYAAKTLIYYKYYINDARDFWGFLRTRIAKFRGVPRETFYLHLKECEFRFNNRDRELFPLLQEILQERPLFGNGEDE